MSKSNLFSDYEELIRYQQQYGGIDDSSSSEQDDDNDFSLSTADYSSENKLSNSDLGDIKHYLANNKIHNMHIADVLIMRAINAGDLDLIEQLSEYIRNIYREWSRIPSS